MNYFQKKLDQKIELNEAIGQSIDLIPLLQAKIEFNLIFVLAVLWEKNFNKIDNPAQEALIRKIERPSIGDIVSSIRQLYLNKKSKRINKVLSDYPMIRNEYIGHGFTFSDKQSELIEKLKRISDDIHNAFYDISNEAYDFILPLRKDHEKYYGINFKSNDNCLIPWQCADCINEFELKSTYILDENNSYHNISPFIIIDEEENLYVYSKIIEKLLGRVLYNNIMTTSKIKRDWENLSEIISIEVDERIKCTNNTIVNAFENNYTEYIDVGIKEIVMDFILKNKSSVTGTIWGHGGVGKTAVIQRAIEELKCEDKRYFDYIIFLSAKDRFYNYKKGEIELVTDRIDSFSDIICKINNLMGEANVSSEENIIQSDSKILIIIDDLETFTKDEVEKIRSFSSKLNINNHKLILTTRANLIIGQEIKTNELNIEQTKTFLQQAYKKEIGRTLTSGELSKSNIIKIHNLTSGRPVFIYQLAYLIAQRGLRYAIMFDIRNNESAIEFLYGRIFEYLSNIAQNIYIAIGQLIREDDRSGTIDVLKFVLDLEKEEDSFNKGFTELIKLKIIELPDKNVYRVYSPEILSLMKTYYSQKNRFPVRVFNQRVKQIQSKSDDNLEKTLLENANSSRYQSNPDEVISQYKQIINRNSSPQEFKLEAIMNCASYLYNDRGMHSEALGFLEKYWFDYNNQPTIVQLYSSFLWANNRRLDSVSILTTYVNSLREIKTDIDLEILGVLATKKAIYLIDNREDLKSNREIIDNSREKWQEQKQDFFNYIDYTAKLLFKCIQENDIRSISSKARHNLFTGSYHSIEVFNRVQKHDEILKYEELLLMKFDTFMRDKLQNKFNRVKDFASRRY